MYYLSNEVQKHSAYTLFMKHNCKADEPPPGATGNKLAHFLKVIIVCIIIMGHYLSVMVCDTEAVRICLVSRTRQLPGTNICSTPAPKLVNMEAWAHTEMRYSEIRDLERCMLGHVQNQPNKSTKFNKSRLESHCPSSARTCVQPSLCATLLPYLGPAVGCSCLLRANQPVLIQSKILNDMWLDIARTCQLTWQVAADHISTCTRVHTLHTPATMKCQIYTIPFCRLLVLQ